MTMRLSAAEVHVLRRASVKVAEPPSSLMRRGGIALAREIAGLGEEETS